MSEYDLWNMFVGAIQGAENHVENFTTLLFGFLVAAYLIGAQLDRTMSVIIVSLYSLMALRYAFLFFFSTDDIVTLADILRSRAMEPDSGISWLEIGPVHIIFYGVFVVMLLSFVASLVFLRHVRKNELRPDFLGSG
jgi:hypothetical protein